MSDIEKIVSNFISLALDVESENFTDGRLQRWNNMLKELEALIQEQVRLARIDEVERFLVEPGEVIPYNNNTFADGFRYVVEKLQARLEELRGEK